MKGKSARYPAYGRFFISVNENGLSALPSLVPRSGKQLAMFVLSHLFSSLLDDASQFLTSNLNNPPTGAQSAFNVF